MPTVFLTGATGFVGSHTARRFLSEGWTVRAMVRNPDRPGLLPAGVEPVRGCLEEADRCHEALRGCDAVVHVAGVVKARTLDEYRAGNARGTEALAKAAAVACPEAMLVLVSSQAAAGPARDGRPITEADPPRPVSWYGQSKLEGEEAVVRHRNGPWCIVRPSVVYGDGDPGVLELYKTVEKGWAPILAGGKTRIQLIAVEDLANILFRAATRPGLTGRRAFAAGDAVATGDLVREVASLRIKRPWTVRVPSLAVRAAGIVESVRQWVTGRARPFNRDKAREILQRDWLCDGQPLLADVGMMLSDLKPWRQGIRDVCRCYLASQWLRPSVWSV